LEYLKQGYHSPLFLLLISSFSPPKPKRRRERGDVGKMGGDLFYTTSNLAS